ncbi:prepilin-type N-terminal cleavage/methylation domain-containing protein [Paenisporosarcina indica]|uniref:prepilin-type N-terminal cleavage/methylation domain-containing protein n=1 Tax=Paenisporosarcina indica TaxID=650093 RepID=UPI0009500307|nr:prepilin-type N-terminal cleavage/methylation domain-containing protein [Paenisporosarcina indica]
MNNERGFSFVEMILTMSILFTLFGSLLPLSNLMMMNLAERKVLLHVAITKNQAATAIMNGKGSGVVILDGIDFTWEWNQPSLCVNYAFFEVSYESCDMY